jgi:acyl-CoA thioesterase
MGGALYSTMAENERCVTVEMKITYFKPVISGTLNCVAEVVHRSRRLGYVEAEVKIGQELVARASGTFSIFTAKAGSQR